MGHPVRVPTRANEFGGPHVNLSVAFDIGFTQHCWRDEKRCAMCRGVTKSAEIIVPKRDTFELGRQVTPSRLAKSFSKRSPGEVREPLNGRLRFVNQLGRLDEVGHCPGQIVQGTARVQIVAIEEGREAGGKIGAEGTLRVPYLLLKFEDCLLKNG